MDGAGFLFQNPPYVEGHTHSDHYHRYRADYSLLPVSDRESSPAALMARLDSDQSAGFYARQRRRVPLPPGGVRWVFVVWWVDGKTVFECEEMVRKVLENCRRNRRHAQSPIAWSTVIFTIAFAVFETILSCRIRPPSDGIANCVTTVPTERPICIESCLAIPE